MADEWDSDGIKPIVAIADNEQLSDGDVKDDWDADSESEKEETVKPPEPPKSIKKKEKIIEPEVDLSKMTSKEREAFLAQKEMQTYGIGDSAENDVAGVFNELRLINSDNVLTQACDLARKVMSLVPSNEHREFLMHFLLEASKDMPSKDQRHIATTLKTNADEKKAGEDKAKKAITKPKKPATKITSKAIAHDMFEDYGGTGAADGYDVDDDFM